jgi:hypothetical protein
MSDKMVFVVCRDGHSEGYSEPLEAFETETLAKLYAKGSADGYGSSLKVFCLFVHEASDFARVPEMYEAKE